LAIVLIVAGLRLIDGQMSVGALSGILGMTAFLTEPMRALAAIVGLFARSRRAAERIARRLGDLAAGRAKDAPAAGPDGAAAGPVVTVTAWPGSGDEFTTAGGELTCIVTETAEHSARLHSALSARARGLGPATMLVAPHDVDLFEGTIGSNITMVVGTGEQDRKST